MEPVRILLVDDESVDLEVMRACLERAGYHVFTATNVVDAQTLFEAHVNEIQLLVTDVSLPFKTGLDLARECLRLKPELKVLFVSGWTGAEFLGYSGIPSTDLHFLAKPFQASKFVHRVGEVLASDAAIGWLDTKTGRASYGEDS